MQLISLRGIKDLQGAIDSVARPGPNGRTTNTNFVDHKTVHQVARSKYGKREVFTSANPLPDARNFSGRAQGAFLSLLPLSAWVLTRSSQ